MIENPSGAAIRNSDTDTVGYQNSMSQLNQAWALSRKRSIFRWKGIDQKALKSNMVQFLEIVLRGTQAKFFSHGFLIFSVDPRDPPPPGTFPINNVTILKDRYRQRRITSPSEGY